MGIFGALTTAISGLRAQSFALEHVSDNIANSQTIGFKRTETSFSEIVSESSPRQQGSGVVLANSRATNTVQGDIQQSDVDTHIAINGDGYFVIEQQSGVSDGQPIFSGVDLYSRRGDFELDRNGYLVNGAGYFLKGLALDPVTGNPSGSLPEVIQITRDLIPAQQTSQIEYRANLAALPKTSAYDPLVPNSELLNPPANVQGGGASFTADAEAVVTGTNAVSTESDFLTNTTIAQNDTLTINGDDITFGTGPGEVNTAGELLAEITNATGYTAQFNGNGYLEVTGPDADTDLVITASASVLSVLGLSATTTNANNLLTQGISQNDTFTVSVGGAGAQTITFGTNDGANEVSTLAELEIALAALTDITASVDATGNINLAATNATDPFTIGGNTSAIFGLSNTTVSPAFTSLTTISAADSTTFLEGSVAGGAITTYDSSGAPVNVQFRWGKTDSVAAGGADTWNLFYLTDSTATGTGTAWQNVGQEYVFGSNGQLTPQVATATIANLTVDGLNLGNISLVHGQNGLSQFSDPNGTAQVTDIDQNGYGSGELASLAITNDGRVTGIYTNGETVEIAEVTIATFNSDGNLRKIDGGAFAETEESGAALLGGGGQVVGQSLEASNSDIADEFAKLIVTQQAYTANTRIVTTSDEMLQEAVNMIR